MFVRWHKQKAQSTLEFMMLLFFVLGAFLIFQKYIVRGMSGRWKSVGDSFSQGRQYDPDKTIECAYDPVYTQKWYNVICYEYGDGVNEPCDCLSMKHKVQKEDPNRKTPTDCEACILRCTNTNPAGICEDS